MNGNITVMGQHIFLPKITHKPAAALAASMISGYPKTSASLKRLMPKYKFSRAKWYIADFKWQDQHRAFEWCNQQFGVHPVRPDAWSRWKTMPGNQFAFRDEKDYNWFVLRWSS